MTRRSRPPAGGTDRRRYPGWLIRLLLLLLVVQTSIQLARPVTSYRVLALDGGALDIGWTTAAFAVLPVLVAVPLGRLVDRWRPGPFIGVAALLTAGAGVMLSTSDSILELAAGNAALGLGLLCLMVPAQALIARRSPDHQHDRDYGLFAAVVAVSQLVGPAVGGLVLTLTEGDVLRGTTVAFLGGAATAALALVACWRLDGARVEAATAEESVGPRPSTVGLLRIPGVPGSMLASLTLIAVVDILTAYLPLIGEQRGIPPATVGLLLSLRAATSIASRVVLASLVARWSRTGLIASSAAASGVALALVTLPLDVVGLAVVLALLGLVAGVGPPLTMSHLVGLTPHQARGTALGLRFTGNRAGQAVLPLAAGAVAADTGVSSAFLLLAALLGGCALLVRRDGRVARDTGSA